MRSTRRTVNGMAAVVTIREVERLAAEATLQAADAEQRAIGSRLEAARADQSAREQVWVTALSASRLNLDLTQMFAGALVTADDAVQLHEGQLERAQSQRQDAAQALRLAQGRLDAASAVAARLARNARRRAEEGRIAETADRAARERWGR